MVINHIRHKAVRILPSYRMSRPHRPNWLWQLNWSSRPSLEKTNNQFPRPHRRASIKNPIPRSDSAVSWLPVYPDALHRTPKERWKSLLSLSFLYASDCVRVAIFRSTKAWETCKTNIATAWRILLFVYRGDGQVLIMLFFLYVCVCVCTSSISVLRPNLFHFPLLFLYCMMSPVSFIFCLFVGAPSILSRGSFRKPAINVVSPLVLSFFLILVIQFFVVVFLFAVLSLPVAGVVNFCQSHKIEHNQLGSNPGLRLCAHIWCLCSFVIFFVCWYLMGDDNGMGSFSTS